MYMTKKKLSVIHIGKKALELSDDDYRTLLRDIGGVDSSKDLDSNGFEAVMFRFHQMGFRSRWANDNFGYRPGMASPNQVGLIRALWKQFTDGAGNEKSLAKWLDHKFHVSSVRFLDADKAHKVIGALKLMTARRAA